MKKIKKGNKATINGYIITEAEKEEYIQLKESVEKVRKMYQNYRKTYYPYERS